MMSNAEGQQENAGSRSSSRTDVAFAIGPAQHFEDAEVPRGDAAHFVDAFEAPARDRVLQTDELLRWQNWQHVHRATQQHTEHLPAQHKQERHRAHAMAVEQEHMRGKFEAAASEASGQVQVTPPEAAACRPPQREKLWGTRDRFQHTWGLNKVARCSFTLERSLDELCGALVSRALSHADSAAAVQRWCPVRLAASGGAPQADPTWPQLVAGLAHSAPTRQQQAVLEALLRSTLLDRLHALMWRGMFAGLPPPSWPPPGKGRPELAALLQQAASGAATTEADGDAVEAALHFYRRSARALSQQVAELDLGAIWQDVIPAFAAASPGSDCASLSLQSDGALLEAAQPQHPSLLAEGSWPPGATAGQATMDNNAAGASTGARGQRGHGSTSGQFLRADSGAGMEGGEGCDLLDGQLVDGQHPSLPKGVAAWCKDVASSLLSLAGAAAPDGGCNGVDPVAAVAWGIQNAMEGGPDVWRLALRVAADAIQLQYTATAVHPELVVSIAEVGASFDERMADNQCFVNVAPGETWARQGLGGTHAQGWRPVEAGSVLLNMLPAVSFAHSTEVVRRGMVCVAGSNVQWAWDLL
jgi:hypothetical protein